MPNYLNVGVAIVVALALVATSFVQAGIVEASPTVGGEFFDNFEGGDISGYVSEGMGITSNAISGSYSAEWTGLGTGYAYNPDVMLENEAGEVSVIFTPDGANSCVGVGFASEDGTWVYVVADPAKKEIRVERRVEDGYSIFDVTPADAWPTSKWFEREEGNATIWEVESEGAPIEIGEVYKITLFFSRRSYCVMAIIEEVSTRFVLARLRTIVDMAPEHPLFLSDGSAKIDNLSFDSSVDDWVYDWEFYPEPVLSPSGGYSWESKNAYNPAVFRGIDDENFYMLYRGSTKGCIGLATSDDGIHWEKYEGNPVLTPEDTPWASILAWWTDPDVLVDPFGDGKYWMEFKAGNSRWATSEDLIHWTVLDEAPLGEGAWTRFQALIDTEREPYIDAVSYEGEEYRFIGYVEWDPLTYVTFSNDLLNWTDLIDMVVISENTWASERFPIGAEYVQPDGNIRVFGCACTPEGYVGSAEAGTLTAVLDGHEPWRVIKQAILPPIPIYYGDIETNLGGAGTWYDGPCFPGDVVEVDNKLYYYFGGNDDHVGLAIATPPTPLFEVGGLSISPEVVSIGEEVTVSVNVANVGEAEGSYTVELSIDGEVVDNQTVTLGPSESESVSFVVAMENEGTYAVQVDGLTGSFDVAEAPPLTEGVPVWQIVAVIVVIVVVVGAVLCWRRGR